MLDQHEIEQERLEALGPAERIVQTLTTHTDHLVHNRPGMVTEDGRVRIGVKWQQVLWKEEDGEKVVYSVTKVGQRQTRTKVGVLNGDGKTVLDGQRVVGEYRNPGLFPEVAAHLYRQVADIWQMDNEFIARWGSWAWPREHKDLKVILAAFLLVQSRSGQPVKDGDEVIFFDDDHRAIGEAMCLLTGRHYIDAKLLYRIGDILRLPGVAEINRELGFGRSARNPALGRYNKAVIQWLRHRESNPPMLAGLMKAGFRTRIRKLASRVGYKPETPAFFQAVRWKQKQAQDGRRSLAIGEEVEAAETWEDLDERAICERIVRDKPGYKRVVGLVPANVGITRAIMAAVIEAGGLSDKDLIILTPTLEELGLLQVQEIKERRAAATRAAEDQRAANIAKNVRSQEAREGLQEAADTAMKVAMEEVTADLRVYVIVDKSGSMDGAIEQAIVYCEKLLVGFPLKRLHVSIFNSAGREINIQHASAAGVQQAFRGHKAGGTTDYSEGVLALSHHKPEPGEDALFIFVGDQGDRGVPRLVRVVEASGINPVAFGMLRVIGRMGWEGHIVEQAALRLNIPCFAIEEELFQDPYSMTRTLQNLIASTPAGQTAPGARVRQRKSLVEEILGTDLLAKPVWA